jgi:hypothetical protein
MVFAYMVGAVDTACANFEEVEWLRKFLRSALIVSEKFCFAKRVAGGTGMDRVVDDGMSTL